MLMPLAIREYPEELPEVDDRLVAPNARYEIEDGMVLYVPPADERHATRHATLGAVLGAYSAEGYAAALFMLTRVSQLDDFAPAVSVYPTARDPETGGRQLEELAFEIASTAATDRAGRRAAKLVGRGVRRVFAIDIDRTLALEWSKEAGAWSVLDRGAEIEDPALLLPLPVAALLDEERADDAIVRAYRERRRPASRIDEAIIRALQARGRLPPI